VSKQRGLKGGGFRAGLARSDNVRRAALGFFATRQAKIEELGASETIVCRCEDVALARLKAHDSWRAAKLQTRCGMGPCQGRICGAAVEFLFGWKSESVRPPVLPVRVESLLVTQDTNHNDL